MNFKKPLLISLCILANLITGSGVAKSAHSELSAGAIKLQGMSGSAMETWSGDGGVGSPERAMFHLSSNRHAGAQAVVNWLTYSNPAFGFSLKYPDTFAILEGYSLPEGTGPLPIHRVCFQDKALLQAQTAASELPRFSVDIFEAPPVPYQDWLRRSGLIPLLSDVDEFPVAGRLGLRVTRREFIAPGQFFFVAKGGWVFRLTPFGEHSESMLRSFTFTN